jgi:hypothetical protein
MYTCMSCEASKQQCGTLNTRNTLLMLIHAYSHIIYSLSSLHFFRSFCYTVNLFSLLNLRYKTCTLCNTVNHAIDSLTHATYCCHVHAFALISFLYRNASQNLRSVTTQIIDWYSEHKHATKGRTRENHYVNKLTLTLAWCCSRDQKGVRSRRKRSYNFTQVIVIVAVELWVTEH